MNEFQQENEKLRQENSELRDKAHQAQVATKMVIFLAACGVVYFLEGVSPIEARTSLPVMLPGQPGRLPL